MAEIPDRKRRPAEPAETFAMGRFGTIVPADPSKPLSEDLVMLGRLIGTDHPRGRAEARGIVERALGDVAAMMAAIVRPSAELQALRLGWQFDVQADEAGEWAWFREHPEHDDDRAVLHGTGWRVYVESAYEAVAEGRS